MSTPGDLAGTYFGAWQAQDWDRLRRVLADDVTFEGPLGTAEGIEECLTGLQNIRTMMTALVVSCAVADETDVITWYELHTDKGVLQTANWSHVEADRITRIRAAFDPRPLTD